MSITLRVDRPSAHVGDTLRYSVTLYNLPGYCRASDLKVSITTPDGSTVPVQLRRTSLWGNESDFYGNVASYVVREQDIKRDKAVPYVEAATQIAAKIHQNTVPSEAVSVKTVNTEIFTPAISIVQNCVDTTGEGGEIRFAGTVKNIGDIALVNVLVTNVIDGVARVVHGPVNLAIGETRNYTGSYRPARPCQPPTVAYSASGVDTLVPAQRVTASGEQFCRVILTPALGVGHTCPVQITPVGGTLAYAGAVTNRGDVTLTNVVVISDQPAAGTVIFSRAVLAPGEVATFTASFKAPVNACNVTVGLHATATSRCGDAVVADSVRTCPLDPKPAIAVTQACPTGPLRPGDVLTYTGTVRNSGDIALTGVVVTSAQPVPGTVVFSAERMEPGAVAEFSGSYTTVLDSCLATNVLTAVGRDVCNSRQVDNNVTTVCPLVGSPAIEITKTCPETPPGLGGTLTYTGTVKNTGNISLVNVVVVSDRPAANTTVFTKAVLAPGESATFTASYPVPANLAGCSITDTLRATAKDRCLSKDVAASTTTTCNVVGKPAVRVVATCPVGAVAPGQEITYAGVVSNPGDVALKNIIVTADLPVAGTVVATVESLAPGASTAFTGKYVTPLDACETTVKLAASATDACAEVQVTDSFVRTCPLTPTPSIAVTKNCPVDPVAPGKPLVFTGTVKNTGNITLNEVVVVNDQPAPNTPVFGPVTLAPGEEKSFSGSFTVPADINRCSIDSALTATGKSKCDARQVSATSGSACPLIVTADILVTTECPESPVAQGELVVFKGSVKNTGNIALTNIVVVNNHPAEATPVVQVALLLPGAATNFVGSYKVPNNCCEVISTVTATAGDLCGTTNLVDTSTMVCAVKFQPAIKITKVCSEEAVEPGGTMKYQGEVRNTGDITLVNVTVSSAVLGTNAPVLGPVDLAPGEVLNYTVSYVVPSDFCGSDTATATAQSVCGNTTVSDSASSQCPVVTTPGIAVQHIRFPGPVPRCAPVTGRATIANTGNVTLTDVRLFASQPENNTPVFGPITLAPGAVTNVTYEFIAPKSCDCCQLAVMVTARGNDKCTGAAVSGTSTAVLPIETQPAINVTLECPTAADLALGMGVISGVVKNTGDITLTGVRVVANLPAAGTVIVGPINLAPGETEYYLADAGTTDPDRLATLQVVASGNNVCGGAMVQATATCDGGGNPGDNLLVAIHTGVEGDVVLTWTSTVGTAYRVEYKDSLTDEGWQDLGDEVVANGPTTSKVDILSTEHNRFYRVYRVVEVR